MDAVPPDLLGQCQLFHPQEAQLGEELGLVGQGEDPVDLKFLGVLQAGLQQFFPDALALERLLHGQGADFRQVLPHHMQRHDPLQAGGTFPIPVPRSLGGGGDGHGKIAYFLDHLGKGPGQHQALGRIVVDQVEDRTGVRGPGPAELEVGQGDVPTSVIGYLKRSNYREKESKAQDGFGLKILWISFR
jgi:hypothetical protein